MQGTAGHDPSDKRLDAPRPSRVSEPHDCVLVRSGDRVFGPICHPWEGLTCLATVSEDLVGDTIMAGRVERSVERVRILPLGTGNFAYLPFRRKGS